MSLRSPYDRAGKAQTSSKVFCSARSPASDGRSMNVHRPCDAPRSAIAMRARPTRLRSLSSRAPQRPQRRSRPGNYGVKSVACRASQASFSRGASLRSISIARKGMLSAETERPRGRHTPIPPPGALALLPFQIATAGRLPPTPPLDGPARARAANRKCAPCRDR